MVISNNQIRLCHLDAVRGFAAIAVLFHHCFYSFRGIYLNEAFKSICGSMPVIIFFILSGFVLSESLGKNNITIHSTFRFYIRRLFRIYPAVIVSLIFAAIVARIVIVPSDKYPAGELFTWFERCAKNIYSIKDYIDCCILKNFFLDNPLWTIKVELYGSLFIPLFIFAINYQFLVLIIGFIIVYINKGSPHIYINDNLWCFYLGFLIYYFKNYCAVITEKSSIILIPFLLLICIISSLYLSHLITSLCCGLLVYLLVPCNSSVIRSFLNTDSAQFFGKISYGLYLVHYPMLFLVWTLLLCSIPWVLLLRPVTASATFVFFTCLTLSIPLAFTLHQFVEDPINKIGHRYFR